MAPAQLGMSIAYSTADGIVWPYEVSLTRSPQFWDAKGPGRRAGRAPGLAAADRSTSNGEELIIMALLTTDHTVQRWERLESAEAPIPTGAVSQPLSVTEATSAMVSLIAAAATLASRCDTDPVPGIGRIEGDRASNQASTICRVVAS
jgi:hypothetical protein